jgi:hypothetical protein
MQISNDVKLNMADGAYKDFRGRYPRHLKGSVGRGRGQVPCGGAPPPSPVNLEQHLAMQNDLMRRQVENDEHCGAEC